MLYDIFRVYLFEEIYTNNIADKGSLSKEDHLRTMRRVWLFGKREALRDTLRGFYNVAANDPDNLGNYFNTAVVSAAEWSLGRTNPKTVIRTPWWSNVLTLLKGEYKRAFRALRFLKKNGGTQEGITPFKGRVN